MFSIQVHCVVHRTALSAIDAAKVVDWVGATRAGINDYFLND